MKEDLNLFIDSEKHLNKLLKKYNLKKYVNYKSHINKAIEICPELYECMINYNTFSSGEINELLGEDLIPYKCRSTSFMMNVIINKLKEKENESML